MRRILAIVLLLALVAVLPAQAASGQISVPQSAQSATLEAAKELHSTSVAPGASLSFLAALSGFDSEGVSFVASALYLALRSSRAVSFDELSYNSDKTGILVNADHDFRFTNLASGALRIAFKTSGDALVCNVSIDESASLAEAAPYAPRKLMKQGNTVSIVCDGDPAQLSNITLAAGSIYDTTLATGDVFSFLSIVGPTAAECGYLPASDGRGETVCGGGVNIVASALWLLIQDRDDIAIVEKSTYGKHYNQTYVEKSADAILTDYASAADFSFRYTGDDSVTFYTVIEEDTLSVIIE